MALAPSYVRLLNHSVGARRRAPYRIGSCRSECCREQRLKADADAPMLRERSMMPRTTTRCPRSDTQGVRSRREFGIDDRNLLSDIFAGTAGISQAIAVAAVRCRRSC